VIPPKDVFAYITFMEKKQNKNPNNMFYFLSKLCLIGQEWKWMRFRV
jgi:hypothetical protein